MGHDNINPFLLKLALPYIVEPLTYIYNFSIINNVFPTILKNKNKAKAIPLPKTNDLGEPNNFRPISILPLLPKPIKRYIHKHVLNFLTEHNLLCQSQSGFRPQRSCHTVLAKLCGNWLSAINNSRLLVLFFLTWKKLSILLIIIFYLRNYPYIQQTPHLSRYLNLIWS